MRVLPRVTELTRERISREFDEFGPDACMAEIKADLHQHNPELLDMASRSRRRRRRNTVGEDTAYDSRDHVTALRPLMTVGPVALRVDAQGLVEERKALHRAGIVGPRRRISMSHLLYA